MTFKVGDKVRVLRVPGVSADVGRVPFESTVKGADRDGLRVLTADGLDGWFVDAVDVEPIEEPAPRFTPYAGWEEDVRRLMSYSWTVRENIKAASRLNAAFAPPEPPKCGKALHVPGRAETHGAALYWGGGRLTCLLRLGHDGPHIPDVPEEAWQ